MRTRSYLQLLWLMPLLTFTLAACSGYHRRPLVDRRVLRELDGVRIEALKPQAPGTNLGSDRVLAIALEWNPELRAFRRERGVAEGQLVAARLIPNPEIQAGALANLSGGGGLGSATASALLALPRPGERDAKVRLAKARIDQVAAEISAQEWKVAGDARKAFLTLLAKRQRLRLAQASLKVEERLRNIYREKQALGDASRLDMNLVEIDYLASLREFTSVSSEFSQAEQTVLRAVGFPPDTPTDQFSDPTALDFQQVAFNAGELETLLLERNSELSAKKQAYEQSEQSLRLAYLQRVPWFRFGPGFEKERGDVEGTTDRLGLQLGIDLPIFNFNQGEIAIRRAERERSHDEYAATLFAARSKLSAALKRIQNQERLIQLFRTSIQPALEENARLTESAFELREFNLAQWVATQDKVFKSRRDYIDAELEYWSAVIDLETLLETRFACVPRNTGGKP